MATLNYKQIFAKKERLKQDWLKINPWLNNNSGIYILTREENEFKFAYIGQAVRILDRLVSHSEGYDQHIDLSLKKHKLFSESNPTGWAVTFQNCPVGILDEQEQFFIKEYANAGYQLRNKTSGSQGEGKVGINDNKPSKTYRDGLKQGELNLKRKLNPIIEKYLIISTKTDSRYAENGLKRFYDLLKIEDGEE